MKNSKKVFLRYTGRSYQSEGYLRNEIIYYYILPLTKENEETFNQQEEDRRVENIPYQILSCINDIKRDIHDWHEDSIHPWIFNNMSTEEKEEILALLKSVHDKIISSYHRCFTGE